jgi:plasmid stabilization system protein ParE
VPRVVWTEEAEEQLNEVESDATFEEIVALAAGLATFPDRGRRVPELRDTPVYDLVRELILSKTARLFYLHIPESDEVVVLGFLLRGRVFTWKILRRYFSSEE